MEEFVVGFRRNRRFDRMVAANFTIEGSGAAVILGASVLACYQCMPAGIAVALIGAGLLFLDLGSPLNFWRSVKKIGRSWISKGVVFFLGMIILRGVRCPPAWKRARQVAEFSAI